MNVEKPEPQEPASEQDPPDAWLFHFHETWNQLGIWWGDFVFEYLKRAIIIAAVAAGGEALNNNWIVGFSLALCVLLGFWSAARLDQALAKVTRRDPDNVAKTSSLVLIFITAGAAAVGGALAMAAIQLVQKAELFG